MVYKVKLLCGYNKNDEIMVWNMKLSHGILKNNVGTLMYAQDN